MTKSLSVGIVTLAVLLFTIAFTASTAAAATPAWNISGDWDITLEHNGTSYTHEVVLTQDSEGNLTGTGGYPINDTHDYEWTLTSGHVDGNTVHLMANYTKGDDAVTPLTTMHATGTVNASGTMTGVWSDNYQGQSRSGTWSTASGMATKINMAALLPEDFGVVTSSTTNGTLTGYTAGFGLTDGTLAGAKAVTVSLYGAGDVLLQKNTAIISAFNSVVTGTQFSSPFDVRGNFDYAADGVWTNVRSAEYGQSVPATKVVAEVTLADDSMVTAQNTTLTGDPSTLFEDDETGAPVLGTIVSPQTIPELSPFSFTATATDDESDDLTFSLIGAPMGATINATSGVFSWTPSEAQGPGTYTFSVAVSDGDLTDSQEVVMNVEEVGAPGTSTPPTSKSQCRDGGWQNFTNPEFKNQGACIKYVNQHQADVDFEQIDTLLNLLRSILMELRANR